MKQPFEQIVQAHGLSVLRVCRSLLDEHRAKDAWSETFLAALRAYPQLDPDANVQAWLVRIAHRKAIDELRRHRGEDLETDPAAHAPSTEAGPEAGPKTWSCGSWSSSCRKNNAWSLRTAIWVDWTTGRSPRFFPEPRKQRGTPPPTGSAICDAEWTPDQQLEENHESA